MGGAILNAKLVIFARDQREVALILLRYEFGQIRHCLGILGKRRHSASELNTLLTISWRLCACDGR